MPPGLFGKHRFDDAPFAVAEFIAQCSMLHFGNSNHAQDQGINGQTACPVLQGERSNSRHREIDAIDPERTSSASRLFNCYRSLSGLRLRTTGPEAGSLSVCKFLRRWQIPK